jgi:Ca2+-binding RTX toxin-like protein
MATIYGSNDADSSIGTLGADTIYGYAGNDTLNGKNGNDYIYGDLGNDSLYSGAGQNFLFGAEGNDTLNAVESTSDDLLFGGIGDDLYIVRGMGNNVVESLNQGIDTIETPNTHSLAANVENLTLTGISLAEGTGNVLDNRIWGNGGRNNLKAGDGNDDVSGGIGNDTLNGEGGNDILNGGTGNDQYVFDTALPTTGVDTIFGSFYGSASNDDKIVLDKTVFSALETVAGNPLMAGDFLVINVAAASEVAVAGNSVNEIVYNIQTHNLFYNPNNDVAGFGPGGGRFATVYGFLDTFSNTSFLVVA